MTVIDTNPDVRRSGLSRLGAVLGIASAAVLLLGGFKRAGLVAESAPVQLVAPLGATLAIGVLVALWARGGSRHGWSLLLAAFGLALTTGGEFILNFVFPVVDDAARAALLAGPLGGALAGSAIVFFVGMAAFAVAQWNAVPAARPGLVLLVVAAVPVALRSVLPPIAVPIGVWLLAVATLWFVVVLLRRP